MSSTGIGPSPATTRERDAESAQLVQSAHSAARSAVKPCYSFRWSFLVAAAAAAAAATAAATAARGCAQDGSAAGRPRRERREQLLHLAGGALRARDERAVARDELLETVFARTARVFVDRHAR